MPSLETNQQFEKITQTLEKDTNAIAFWLDGSRGKKMETEHSDYDARIIVKESVKQEYKDLYENISDPDIDISVMTLNELKEHAEYGSEMSWDRYNFTHLKVIFDKSGKIQKIIDDKAKRSKTEQDTIINNSLGAFINQVYRLEKDMRDNNILAAKLEAIEAIPFFLEAIFALEGRIRPYNKYLEWELNNFPLTIFPWKKGELISIILEITENKQLHRLHELFTTIKPLFKKAGYNEAFDEWNGHYKVG
ncbi:hypothetical protein COB57_02470 [Candidatus Peregrinibacteria bacterium]|nr:MAG: hypothetical protein COB57_02470 [Candidatus Peregrinibacteria bacterium]